VLITRFGDRSEPLFRPRFLGEKAEGLDFLVELVSTYPRSAFCFVQVKTTTLGLTARGRLRVGLDLREVRRLLHYPAATYLVGIDARDGVETGYIISVNQGPARRIASLSTRFPLDGGNLRILWEEVTRFWSGRDMRLSDSHFRDRG